MKEGANNDISHIVFFTSIEVYSDPWSFTSNGQSEAGSKCIRGHASRVDHPYLGAKALHDGTYKLDIATASFGKMHEIHCVMP